MPSLPSKRSAKRNWSGCWRKRDSEGGEDQGRIDLSASGRRRFPSLSPRKAGGEGRKRRSARQHLVTERHRDVPPTKLRIILPSRPGAVPSRVSCLIDRLATLVPHPCLNSTSASRGLFFTTRLGATVRRS